MGQMFQKLSIPSPTVKYFISRKRKYSEDDDSDGEFSEMKQIPHCPKRQKMRKKLLSTPQYIYQALFKEGTDSDITLSALGNEWRLHKVYLCQSPYFASMFSGAWKESSVSAVNIEVVDPKITVESLSVVLGSLYLNELELEVEHLVGILATATLFQLDSVVDRCAEVMNETLNIMTVLPYNRAAVDYGVVSVSAGAFKWLLTNLLTYVLYVPQVLSAIDVRLMTKLVRDENLFVVQTESSIYFMLQVWLYYKLEPPPDIELDVAQLRPSPSFYQKIIEQSSKYFQSLPGTEEYLSTEEGEQYLAPFQALRCEHLFNLYDDLTSIKANRILPSDWITAANAHAWSSMLRLDQGLDRGPKDWTEEMLGHSLRCGRLLPDDSEHVWRWTGFMGGLDLVWSFAAGTLRVRRCHRGNDTCSLLSMNKRRYIGCKITIVTLNQNRQIIYTDSTEKTLSFLKHEEIAAMETKALSYPTYLLAELNISTPELPP